MVIISFKKGAVLTACPKCNPEILEEKKKKRRRVHRDYVTELRQRRIDDDIKPEE